MFKTISQFSLLLILLLSSIALSALADPLYTNGSLKGRYFLTLIEIRDDGGGTDYCDISGFFNFDGAGGAVGTTTNKCSLSGTTTGNGTFEYSVLANGEFHLAEPGLLTIDYTHGRIVDSGQMLLLDGTTRTDSAVFVQNGVMVRRR